jgi:hypothetical protein
LQKWRLEGGWTQKRQRRVRWKVNQEKSGIRKKLRDIWRRSYLISNTSEGEEKYKDWRISTATLLSVRLLSNMDKNRCIRWKGKWVVKRWKLENVDYFHLLAWVSFFSFTSLCAAWAAPPISKGLSPKAQAQACCSLPDTSTWLLHS